MRDRGYYLGRTHEDERVYMEKFSWDCGWYWGGGYLQIYDKGASEWNTHTHFDTLYGWGGTAVTRFKQEFDECTLSDAEVWRLFDLMKQFYAYKEAAGCFKHGGHYTSTGRTDAEIDMAMNKKLNDHIKEVIIPQVDKLFAKEDA